MVAVGAAIAQRATGKLICKRRLRERNARGEHPFVVDEAQYDLFTSYFVPPEPGEGFNVVVHTP